MASTAERLEALPRPPAGREDSSHGHPAGSVVTSAQPQPASAAVPGEARRGRLFTGTRVRILFAFGVLTAVAFALSLLLVHRILTTRLDEDVAAGLTQEVAEFRRLVRGNDPATGRPFGTDVARVFDAYFARNVPDEGEVLLSAIDDRLYRSARAADAEFRPGEVLRAIALESPLDRPGSGTVETSSGSARYLSVPVEANGRVLGTFAVANYPAAEQQEIRDALTVAAEVTALVLLLAFAVAWAGAGRVLAPLRLLRETAQSITESDLSRRIPVDGDDEVARLAHTFNEMLDRVEAGFAAQRRFVDDAGHELRTPITIVRGHLELLSDDPDERRETIALVTDELDRMSRMVNELLLLARAEQPDFLELEPVDVEALTGELHTKLLAFDRREWLVESTGTGWILADRQRLTQAAVQLAENAVKQTGEGDAIALGTFVAGGEARLWVRDTGPGIPEHEQEAIFERFTRGRSGRRSDGAGLGLSIVHAIAAAHGGRVELRSRPGGGATFTLVVPVAGPRRRA